MKEILRLSIVLGILVFAISCQQKPQKPLQLISEQVITTVPSASGVVKLGDQIYIVGDDAYHIFQLNSKNEIEKQYIISSINNLVDGRIVKALKPDFEALDYFDDQLLVLGSGSVEVSRDTAVLFSMKEKKVLQKAFLRPLYRQLMLLAIFDTTEQINIEGLASDSNYFYLLQRGNIGNKNDIFQIKKADLLHYLNTLEIPEISIHSFELPKIDGYLSGFSGACISPDGQFLLFTSSVESTEDVYHDGEVLGSFVGAIPITGKDAWKSQQTFVLSKNDTILKTKLESIWVEKQTNGLFELLAVSDNDNGESGIYHLVLNLSDTNK